MINGDLFPRVVAFSPGFVVEGTAHGKPRLFISHGTADPILPIDRCSRVIVPALRARGYDVTFREFDGGHERAGRNRARRHAMGGGHVAVALSRPCPCLAPPCEARRGWIFFVDKRGAAAYKTNRLINLLVQYTWRPIS